MFFSALLLRLLFTQSGYILFYPFPSEQYFLFLLHKDFSVLRLRWITYVSIACLIGFSFPMFSFSFFIDAERYSLALRENAAANINESVGDDVGEGRDSGSGDTYWGLNGIEW